MDWKFSGCRIKFCTEATKETCGLRWGVRPYFTEHLQPDQVDQEARVRVGSGIRTFDTSVGVV